MTFSVVVPVYNRPAAVDTLLRSLTRQTRLPDEVVVVDDGSSEPCRSVCQRYSALLPLHYYYIDNSGPGACRHYGVQQTKGDFLLFFDSDVMLPDDYMERVAAAQEKDYADAFGGQDRAHPSFSPLQKAISYAMTAFFTTGGIRGGRRRAMDTFYPRSYDMGIARAAYDAVGGFAAMRYGEDIDLSLRLRAAGYRCCLRTEAWVWHARRDTLRQFFRQVYHSGEARLVLRRRHPQSMRVVHVLPALFTVVAALLCATAVVGVWFSPWWLLAVAPLLLYCILIFIDAYCKEGSCRVAVLSIAAAMVQLTGYGSGFLVSALRQRKETNDDKR